MKANLRQVFGFFNISNGGQQQRTVAAGKGQMEVFGDDLRVVEVVGGVKFRGFAHVKSLVKHFGFDNHSNSGELIATYSWPVAHHGCG